MKKNLFLTALLVVGSVYTVTGQESTELASSTGSITIDASHLTNEGKTADGKYSDISVFKYVGYVSDAENGVYSVADLGKTSDGESIDLSANNMYFDFSGTLTAKEWTIDNGALTASSSNSAITAKDPHVIVLANGTVQVSGVKSSEPLRSTLSIGTAYGKSGKLELTDATELELTSCYTTVGAFGGQGTIDISGGSTLKTQQITLGGAASLQAYGSDYTIGTATESEQEITWHSTYLGTTKEQSDALLADDGALIAQTQGTINISGGSKMVVGAGNKNWSNSKLQINNGSINVTEGSTLEYAGPEGEIWLTGCVDSATPLGGDAQGSINVSGGSKFVSDCAYQIEIGAAIRGVYDSYTAALTADGKDSEINLTALANFNLARGRYEADVKASAYKDDTQNSNAHIKATDHATIALNSKNWLSMSWSGLETSESEQLSTIVEASTGAVISVESPQILMSGHEREDGSKLSVKLQATEGGAISINQSSAAQGGVVQLGSNGSSSVSMTADGSNSAIRLYGEINNDAQTTLSAANGGVIYFESLALNSGALIFSPSLETSVAVADTLSTLDVVSPTVRIDALYANAAKYSVSGDSSGLSVGTYHFYIHEGWNTSLDVTKNTAFTLEASSAITLHFDSIDLATPSDYFVLIYGSPSFTVTADLLASLNQSALYQVGSEAVNLKGQFAVENNNLVWRMIPEPTTTTLSLLALACWTAHRRRRISR